MQTTLPDKSPLILLEEIFPSDTNPYKTAFGGKILALMDRAAGLSASKFAKAHFVTASMDAVDFLAPIFQGEIAQLEAQVVYTSRRTCGVQVRVFAVGKTDWVKRLCCQGLIFMVALDEQKKLLDIPAFKPRGRLQQQAWKEAASVHQKLLKRKQQGRAFREKKTGGARCRNRNG